MSVLTEVLFTILSYGPKISRSLLKYAYDNKPWWYATSQAGQA